MTRWKKQGHTHFWSILSLEDKDFRVLTQMLKITYGNQCSCVCVRNCVWAMLRWWLLDIVIYHPNKCSLKRWLQHSTFLFPIPSPGFDAKSKISTQSPPIVQRNNWFYKTTMRRKDRSLELQTPCFSPQWTAMASWKTDKATVALWNVHLLVLFIFYFICIFLDFLIPIAQRNKETFFFFFLFFFTYRYIVS